MFENHDQKHPNKDSYRRWITRTRKKTIENNGIIREPDDLRRGDIVICCRNLLDRYETYDSNGQLRMNTKGKPIKTNIYNNERLEVINQTTNPNGKITLDMKKQDGTYVMGVTNQRISTKNYDTFLFTLDKSETTYKYQGITIRSPENYIIEEAHHKRKNTDKPITKIRINPAKIILKLYFGFIF